MFLLFVGKENLNFYLNPNRWVNIIFNKYFSSIILMKFSFKFSPRSFDQLEWNLVREWGGNRARWVGCVHVLECLRRFIHSRPKVSLILWIVRIDFKKDGQEKSHTKFSNDFNNCFHLMCFISLRFPLTRVPFE